MIKIEQPQAQPQAQQQRPLVPYTNPMGAYGSSIILLTNPENAVFKVECKFRNIKVDDEGKVVRLGDPLMNDYGISQVIGMIESAVNESTVWAWLEDRPEVDNIRNFFADTLARDLMRNRVVYNISDESARDRIFMESVIFVHLCLKRAFKQGERGFWKGSNQNVRHEVVQQQASKNWLGWLKRK